MRLKKRNIALFKKSPFNIIFILLITLILCLTGCSGEAKGNEGGISETGRANKEIFNKILPIPNVYTAKLNFTGDLMVHSYQYNESYDSSTGSYEFDHNFEAVKKYFDSANYTIGNLETVLGGDDIGPQDYPCFNTPDSFAEAAQRAGFDLFTTANNHCCDQGTAALIRTLDTLDSLNIAHVGTSRSQEERDKIVVKDINGITFAFLSYTYGTNGMPYENEYNVNLLNEQDIVSDIQKAKALNPDFIVVMPHWGTEYQTQPNQNQRDIADIIFNAGVDIIIGSHPHVLQPMEIREIQNSDGTTREGFIIYSMGNFISSQTTPPRNASIILNMDFKKVEGQKAEITKVSFVPIWTQFRNGNNVNDFVVRSVYDVLTDPEKETKYRAKDLSRVNDIHYETTSLLLNKNIALEDIQDEYTFYERQAD